MQAFYKQNPSILLLLPYALVLTVLAVGPVGMLVDMSFMRHSAVDLTGNGWTLENYRRAADTYYIRLLLETLKLAFLSTVIGAILAYPVAYMIARAGRWKTVLILIVMIPLMTSVVVKVLGWYIVLGAQGPVNQMLMSLGLGRVRFIGTEGAVLLGLVEFALPFMIFSLAAAIERVPPSLEEAAANLGAGAFTIFLKVILPLSRPGLVSGFLLCFGVSASAYVVPATLGGTSVRMAAQEVFDQVQSAFNWPGASALSVLLMLILGSTIYVAVRIGSETR